MNLHELIRKDLNIINEAKAAYKWYIYPERKMAHNVGINDKPSIILFQDVNNLKYYIVEIAIGKLNKKMKMDGFGQFENEPTKEEKELYINLNRKSNYIDINFFKNSLSEYIKIKEFIEPQDYYDYIVIQLGIEGKVLEATMDIKPTYNNAYKIGIYTIQIPNNMKDEKKQTYVELFKKLDNYDTFTNILNHYHINNINVIFTILAKFWGDYQPYDKTIRLNIKKDIVIDKFVTTIMHEIGHDIYHTYLSAENTRIVEQMWKNAKSEQYSPKNNVSIDMPICSDYRVSEYAMSNDDEYFAEVFACYCIDKLIGKPKEDFEKIIK